MAVDSSRPPWWRRMFRRKRYDPREARRVSALPPRLDLHLTTPMTSRLDVSFIEPASASAVNLTSRSDMEVLKPAPPIGDAAAFASYPTGLSRQAENIPPVPPLPAGAQPASTGVAKPVDIPAKTTTATAPQLPPSPPSPGFRRRLHSTTRASGSLTARTQAMAGYSVTTYVPSASDSAASEMSETSDSKHSHSSGASGSRSVSAGDPEADPLPQHEAEVYHQAVALSEAEAAEAEPRMSEATQDSAYHSIHESGMGSHVVPQPEAYAPAAFEPQQLHAAEPVEQAQYPMAPEAAYASPAFVDLGQPQQPEYAEPAEQYNHAEQYEPAEQYEHAEQYQPAEQYEHAEHYQAAEQHAPAPQPDFTAPVEQYEPQPVDFTQPPPQPQEPAPAAYPMRLDSLPPPAVAQAAPTADELDYDYSETQEADVYDYSESPEGDVFAPVSPATRELAHKASYSDGTFGRGNGRPKRGGSPW